MIATSKFSGYFTLIAAVCFILSGCGGGGGGGSTEQQSIRPVPPQPTVNPTSIQFTEVSNSGLSRAFSEDFDLLSDAERFGGGVAAGDVDNDGDTDVYIVGRDVEPNHLYLNQGKGTFVEVGHEMGVDVLHWGSGPAFGDMDGDGDLDLFVGAVDDHPIFLFENRLDESEGKFVDITLESGISTTARNTVSALFYDYDRDGFLDLFLTHWGETWRAGTDTDTVWRNNGDKTFSSMSQESGIASTLVEDGIDWSFTPAFSDIDRDGDGDLFVASDYGESQIYLNNDDGTFTRITDREVIIDQNGMGSALGDYDNDGDMDWFVTSIFDLDGENGIWFGNRIYEYVGNSRFVDATRGSNLDNGDWGWGTCAGDFDNDGYLDLVEVNGWVTADHKDYQNRPMRFFHNQGLNSISFNEIHEEVNLVNSGQGRALACFDGDHDGDLDILLVNGSPDHIIYYRNDTPRNHNYLSVRLVGLGANRFGAGARVEITSSNGKQIREMGSNNNFTSHDPLEVHFGLAEATSADVLVTWPDQTTSELLNVVANQRLRIFATESNLRLVVTNGQGTGSYGLGERVVIRAREPEHGYHFSHWGGDETVRFEDRYSEETTITMPNHTVSIQAHYLPGAPTDQDISIARRWNEVLLQAIRNDYARPTVHARNLFHISAAMYDAWSAGNRSSQSWLLGSRQANTSCVFNITDEIVPVDAVEVAISIAAYRLIRHRFANSPGASSTTRDANALMDYLGIDRNNRSRDYVNDPGVGLGNYISDCYIEFGRHDGANETNDYESIAYVPINPPLKPDEPGNPDIVDLNRWQPLALETFVDQAGNPTDSEPKFISPEWGRVWPFSLRRENLSIFQRDGYDYWVYHDPGPPPPILQEDDDTPYKWGFELVAHWSSHLNPTDGVIWDISPASLGNIQTYPQTFEEYRLFYRELEGGDEGQGYAENPKTGSPYSMQSVPRGDYTRVLAEFWADGPDSETPPGHWFVILNQVNEHPELEKRFQGDGPVLDDLEWDIKAYFTLGGAMHDAAITAWGIKGWYDYIRPISAVRAITDLGQSSDTTAPSYHADGIRLRDGLVELVTSVDALAGENQQHVNKVKLYSWRGPDRIEDPIRDVAGVGWILAENWWPYQRPSFVTPPFAGYVSGHSTYSRAAAEVLTALTGDKYFPGGMSEFKIAKDTFLKFERGPSVNMALEWATYYDASDQCSLSRIWGGIHPPADDIPGRLIGIKVGLDAFEHAKSFF